MPVTTATITNAGQTLLAGRLISSTADDPRMSYVALGLGCGLLTNALTNGNTYTALQVPALAVAVPANASLTIINGANTQVVTDSGAGAIIGATVINVISFVANHAYPTGSGVVTTPLAADVTLFNEAFRNVTTSGVTGGAPGEVLASLYIAPTDGASTTYLEVGWFGGAAATGAANTGVLIARAIYWFPHVLNIDSAMAQLDTTV
jgi:hypothetical protein